MLILLPEGPSLQVYIGASSNVLPENAASSLAVILETLSMPPAENVVLVKQPVLLIITCIHGWLQPQQCRRRCINSVARYA